MDFYILDTREVWWKPAIAAAERHGHKGKRIFRGSEVKGEGIGFIRPHAEPNELRINKAEDDPAMRQKLLMIQDSAQVEVYEDKSEQFRRWGKWLPYTVRSTSEEEALDALPQFFEVSAGVVSKADVGASSRNVLVFTKLADAQKHVRQIFREGWSVNHCTGGNKHLSLQKDHVLLQEFVPKNEFTWRVNRIGDYYCIFQRYNYPDKPVAMTGNTKPLEQMTELGLQAIEFSLAVTEDIGTKWVALDLVYGNGDFHLLETSLAWPWPGAAGCQHSPFWTADGERSPYAFPDMFDIPFIQIEEGTWASQ